MAPIRETDRDAVAAASIEWARKGISSVALGSSLWNRTKPLSSDAQDAFRKFSKREMKEVKGAMAQEVQNDLRAVHWRHGFLPNSWESEAMRHGNSVGSTAIPERVTKNWQKTQFKIGSGAGMTYRTSLSNADLRTFTNDEMNDAKSAMSDSVRKDLRAVHIFAPCDKADWKSDAMSVGRYSSNIKAPERLSQDNWKASHIHLGSEELSYTSDAKAFLREFSQKERDSVKAAMAKEVQDDLRAVHFRLGTDKGVLDRHISDRVQSGPVRPQSAPVRRNRLRSAC
jgi:hypothetical protein